MSENTKTPILTCKNVSIRYITGDFRSIPKQLHKSLKVFRFLPQTFLKQAVKQQSL